MKKYLITGCAGFIGSNFVYYMLKKYEDIKLINLDKDVTVAKIAKVRQTAEGTDGQEEELPEGEATENIEDVTPDNEGAENTEDISGKDTEE